MSKATETHEETAKRLLPCWERGDCKGDYHDRHCLAYYRPAAAAALAEVEAKGADGVRAHVDKQLAEAERERDVARAEIENIKTVEFPRRIEKISKGCLAKGRREGLERAREIAKRWWTGTSAVGYVVDELDAEIAKAGEREKENQMAMLDKVTVTGADNGTSLSVIPKISEIYPFIEWGILISASNDGSPRYPAKQWRDQLALRLDRSIHVSLHVQGRYLRKILLGDPSEFIEAGGELLEGAERVQLNFHGEPVDFDRDKFAKALAAIPGIKKQFIFQHDGTNGAWLLRSAVETDRQLDCVPFYDTSHGAGILPDAWPEAEYPADWYRGYAGGLGPENVAEQIPLIAKAAGGARFWIDMESRVRANERFVIAKVVAVAEKCKNLVGVEL